MQVRIDERLRRSLISRYWKEGIKTLTVCQAQVIQWAGMIDPNELKSRVNSLLQREPMNKYLEGLWQKTGATFALQTDRKIRAKGKAFTPDMEIKADEIDFWEDYFRHYYNERSQSKLRMIMDTQTEIVNRIIDKVLDEGMTTGQGIPALQRQMVNELSDGLTLINKYQAERIARTEVIGSSNKGSFEAADRTGLVKAKAWRTSGLPGVRPSHQTNEGLGEVSMDYVYTGNCKYPGDPNGEAGEIINCRCTHIFEVD